MQQQILPPALPRGLGSDGRGHAFSGLLLDLGSPQFIVDPLFGYQLSVAADLCNFAFVKHVDAIDVDDGRKPVGDNNVSVL